MSAILKMLRVPNLLIIALTFFILRYLVFFPVYSAYSLTTGMGSLPYILLVTATLLIAAAGYISNDYFDVVTDRINKPKKQYIGLQISPGSALATAFLLSIASTALAVWLCLLVRSLLPAIILFTALVVAWWYAMRLKKSFLLGNIAVACMSAGTIAMAWIIEKQYSPVPDEPSDKITYIVVAVSSFAFLLSFLREIVKDMEDMEGDRLMNCRSLPLVKGVSITKRILYSGTAITLVLLILAQITLIRFSLPLAAIWLLLGVEIPLILFIRLLIKAQTKEDFHRLSRHLKFIMLGGILTIVAGQF